MLAIPRSIGPELLAPALFSRGLRADFINDELKQESILTR
jgi:hypothetical protein